MKRTFLGMVWLGFLTLQLFGQTSWGSFPDKLDVELLPAPGHNILLLADFVYNDPDGLVWTAPKGLVSDGASIPQVFWSIVGGPLDGSYREAAVIHDEYCDTKSRSWQDTDLAFYNAMRCAEVADWKAKVMYYAVVHFGPHWGPGYTPADVQASMENSKRPLSLTIERETEETNIPSTEGPRPEASPSDIESWVKTQNPSLEEIRNTPPSALAPPSSNNSGGKAAEY